MLKVAETCLEASYDWIIKVHRNYSKWFFHNTKLLGWFDSNFVMILYSIDEFVYLFMKACNRNSHWNYSLF